MSLEKFSAKESRFVWFVCLETLAGLINVKIYYSAIIRIIHIITCLKATSMILIFQTTKQKTASPKSKGSPKFHNVSKMRHMPQQVWSLHWGMDEKTKRIVEKTEARWTVGGVSCDGKEFLWYLMTGADVMSSLESWLTTLLGSNKTKIWRHFWRWFSLSPGGRCWFPGVSSLEGNTLVCL